ncbi:MAG: YgiQ family radical SAM protein, partial [Candidatus Peribacteraceae bacterium]|nr:YgiQ family radical SAM protein [Candidatus Peribacteraceae bacterium]
ESDKYSKNVIQKPDRAVVSYANMIRQNFKETPIVIGGVEAALRRFAHFDYWSNKIRRSILPESRANILVYGNPEYAILEIAKRYNEKKNVDGIPGTCVARNKVPEKFNVMPSFKEVSKDKRKFCKMQMMFNNEENLAQKIADKYILQYKTRRYTTEELDYIYELGYSRDVPETAKHLKGMQFSVVTHRGCFGNCSFCSIALMQGTRIVSRSEESILNEIKKITKHKDFKGYIDDLGGPSANMYGMDCYKCHRNCIECDTLDKSHTKIISLMQKAREIKGVKKVFVRSGIRHDLAIESKKYIEEISKHHISGYLKIAPEHTSLVVLKLMNKYSPGTLEKFIEYYKEINKDNWQSLKFYLIASHPGSTKKENDYLKRFIREVGRDVILQTFTPTPMTMSTCMYYTETDPRTGDGVYVPRGFRDKKDQKIDLMNSMGGNMGRSFRHDASKGTSKPKQTSSQR